MTKEKFINSDREYYICRICKSKIKKQYIPYNHAMDSGMSSSCRMCDYLARHKDIELLENWNYEEYKNVIYQIFNEGKEFINDIIIDNKTLSDVVTFISSLHINGVKLKVNVNCAVCNEKITCYPTKYLNNQNIFCCREHYNQYRKEHTFTDERGVEYLANWHMRFTGIPGRIFFIPQYEDDKILVCYIGKKLKNVSYPT